ncbi:sulfonate transport system substrate-binding protein [Streptomyces sp. DvalAA-14]|uniref:ABC transporter substrate-binding protein n=1 Tax=unclassified Streptomyces TaxID=2593676 RepID=UPI00081AFAA4|nr:MULTISPECIES: ABC transporter substrate-binding protein [unclassified Streptomyces]MYS19811.1 ABC transporter substrate-binding protein [Streptomyces sp. SID4948]SCD53916.1 sulfonate transport system substrate-binding protein [Streptomyces sp. DvalAA-14]
MPLSSDSPLVRRRSFLALTGGAALALAGCARKSEAGSNSVASRILPSSAPPPGTKLAISIHTAQLQLADSGLGKKLPFTVSSWPNLTAGPDVIQGFRAHSIDLASNAGIPPIQAQAIGLGARIVAVQTRNHPIYTFATRPGSGIRDVRDFRGKKIGFSQGQAQGVVVLRALKEAGLKNSDVRLVPLPSTQFLTALQAKQVDVAPLAEPTLTKYLGQYGRDGARGVHTDVVDLLTILWAPVDVLNDEAKAAAIRSFVPLWARGVVWAWENSEAWIASYYVKDQGVTAADGRRIVSALARPQFPVSWDKAIAWEQESADLMAEGGFVPKVDAAGLFDRRFEGLAARAVAPQYQVAS